MNRGTRRAQKQRHLARCLRIVRGWYSSGDLQWQRETARKLAAHGKLCSCHMCGNPRRHHGEITIQERRDDLRHRHR